MLTHQHPHNKSIMVSLLGRPNAGKSTLINYLLGFDLSIVSPKPQTTRNSFHCNFTVDKTEVVLVDTPGIHKAGQEMNIRMNGQAQVASEGSDLNLILVDVSTENVIEDFRSFLKNLGRDLSRSWVIFNKVDKCGTKLPNWEEMFQSMKKALPNLERYFCISAKEGENIHELIGGICDVAPEGPHLYPYGDVSNKNLRFFAAEYIREQAFRILKDEVPYELAVVIDDYKDVKDPKSPVISRISASILVNRPSQRAIVVGSKGSVIKKIGTNARKKIEALVGGKVHLNLHVKVSGKWFKNNFVLEELGLPRVQGSRRVWRKR